MTVLRKWDHAKREYVPLEVPDGWRVSCYEADMDAAVDYWRRMYEGALKQLTEEVGR